jgi:hypothetical protein
MSFFIAAAAWPCFVFTTQIVGVILAAVASIISNLGLNFQKLSHTKAHVSAEADSSRNYTTDKIWILGISLIIFGSLRLFLQLTSTLTAHVSACR